MTRYFLSLFLLIALSSGAQQSKMNFSLQKKVNARIADREIALFVKGDIDVIRQKTMELGGTFKYSAGDIASIRIRLSKVQDLASVASVLRIESNDMKLQPMNDQMIVQNHVLEVQSGFGLPQSYNGEGVVMGIIDEGIDFTHPDFRDEFGHTRIAYLWDQAIINFDTATQAHPYGYGKEYSGSQIDTSTQHFDSPFGHGSHVAGIAAGNGLSVNNYRGVAPKSELIIVKANLNQPDNNFLSSIVDAVKYIFDRADEMNKPVVINISLGTYFGSHDARDIQAQAIDNLIAAKPGRVLVCSAGNAGGAPIHLGYNVTTDTSFTWMQFSSNAMYIQAWGDSANFENINFSIGLDRIKPDHKKIARTQFRNALVSPGVVITDTLFANGNRVAIVEQLAQFWNGNYSIEFMIYPDSVMNITGNDTSRYYARLMTTGSGRLDAWSFDMVFDNLPDANTLPEIVRYKKPDTDQTIVSSFTCSDKVITVGSYVNRNYYTNSNFSITRDTMLTTGALSAFSSKGPTRDGRIKPDIAATGEWVLSCGTQAELSILSATEPEKVAAGKKHKRSSGTSMASPVVAGIAALYLQKNPTATWADVKDAILNCADEDQFTGSNLPNNDWGYGKVNGFSVVRGCTVGLDELANQENGLVVSPNPSTINSDINLKFSRVNSDDAVIVIYDLPGSVVKMIPLEKNAGQITIANNELRTGIYFCTLINSGKISATSKIIKF